MEISIGPLPVAIRIKSSAALTGVNPAKAGKSYIPDWKNGMFRYSDPDNDSLDVVDAGGVVDFADDHILRIAEIRSFLPTSKTIEALIVDKIQEMTFVFGAPPAAPDFTALGIEEGDVVTVSSGATPDIEVYTVTRVLGALVLEVNGNIVDRNLTGVNPDSVKITSPNGGIVRYEVTLGGTDTVDITGEAPSVHIIGAATAGDDVRFAFAEPPIVLSTQFVKVITSDAGIVDVYVVKASAI
jgi:hypothetical protein